MRNEPAKDLLDEWIIHAAPTSSGGVPSRDDAEALKEHAVADLQHDGITEEQINAVTNSDFGGYVLRILGT